MPRVLIIDDSLSVLKVAERMLTQAGLEVATAKNGTEALERLPKERPDVIISDVLMPDKTGYEVCTFVRTHPVLADTPILLISGILSDEVARQAESCRADGILKKPFQGTTLKDRVFELIAKRQQDTPAAAAATVTPSPGPVQAEGVQITAEQAEALTKATAQLKDLETALATEQARVAELTERLAVSDAAKNVQVTAEQAEASAEATAKLKDLETALATEQARVAELTERLAVSDAAKNVQVTAEQSEASAEATAQLKDLEAALATEQARVAELTERLAQADAAQTRVTQLEATLHAERDAANQLVEQIDESEQAAGRVHELETLLAKETEKTTQLSQKLMEMELAVAQARPREDGNS